MRSKRKEPPETFLLYHIYYNKIYCFSTFFNRLKNCNHIKPARDDIAGRLLESQQLLFFAIEFLLGEKSLLLQLGELADFIRDERVRSGLVNRRSLLHGLLHRRSLLHGLLLSRFRPVNGFVDALFSAVDQRFSQVAERVTQLGSRIFPRVFQI